MNNRELAASVETCGTGARTEPERSHLVEAAHTDSELGVGLSHVRKVAGVDSFAKINSLALRARPSKKFGQKSIIIRRPFV